MKMIAPNFNARYEWVVKGEAGGRGGRSKIGCLKRNSDTKRGHCHRSFTVKDVVCEGHEKI